MSAHWVNLILTIALSCKVESMVRKEQAARRPWAAEEVDQDNVGPRLLFWDFFSFRFFFNFVKKYNIGLLSLLWRPFSFRFVPKNSLFCPFFFVKYRSSSSLLVFFLLWNFSFSAFFWVKYQTRLNWVQMGNDHSWKARSRTEKFGPKN